MSNNEPTPEAVPNDGASAVRVLLAETRGWGSVQARSDDDAEQQRAERTCRLLERQLVDVLAAEHLVVLSGLGTSRAVRNPDGTALAPTMAELWSEAAELQSFDAAVEESGYRPDVQGEDIEALLSRCQMSQELGVSGSVGAFLTAAETLIVGRCRFLRADSDLSVHEAFLRRIARRSTRLPRTQLFTTNYDLAYETAAARTEFVVIDGFSYTSPSRFNGTLFEYDLVRRGDQSEPLAYIPNLFHLYKLHGSVSWEQKDGEILRAGEPEHPVLIYPRQSKYELSYNRPFLEAMSRFQFALRRPNTALLVVGFGFNDHHLNEPILNAVRSNIGLRIAVVGPHLETSQNRVTLEFQRLIAAGDARLTMLNMTFEELVPRLPDLVPVSEAERHDARFERPAGS
jgi:SIR2-like domain